jgi:hypothetical protein
MLHKRSKWPWILALLPFLLVLALIPTRAFIRLYIENKLGPEQYAEFRKYFDDPVTLPEEWRVVEPFPADLIEAAAQFAEAKSALLKSSSGGIIWKEHLYGGLKNSGDLPPDKWEKVHSIISEHTEVLDAYSKLVDHPNFELAVLPIDSKWGTLDLYKISEYTKVLCLKAHEDAHQGDLEKALDSILTVFRGARHHSAGTLMEYMVATVLVGIAVGEVEPVASRCADPTLLRRVLSELNELDATINQEFPSSPLLSDAVGQLRIFKRLGSKVDLETPQPPAGFNRQALRIQIEKYPDSFTHLERLTKSGFLRLRLRLERFAWQNDVVSLLFLSQELQSADAWKSLSGFEEDALRTAQQFDLARLFLVKRILEMEGRETPTTVAELVPEFFEEEPLDSITGEPYKWDAETGEFVASNAND